MTFKDEVELLGPEGGADEEEGVGFEERDNNDFANPKSFDPTSVAAETAEAAAATDEDEEGREEIEEEREGGGSARRSSHSCCRCTIVPRCR